MSSTYDFIIVGAGTSGCLLAQTLSRTPASPSILLLEAGSNPTGPYLRAPFHRFAAVALRPDLNHGYVSEPEPSLNNREIPYARGKGLGGSSILNFGVYLYGSSEDYERWAELVEDQDWSWESVRDKFRAMETYNCSANSTYSDPSAAAHGTCGPLKIGLPRVLEKGVGPQIEALRDAGEAVNLDPNDGDVLGVSVFPWSYSEGGRQSSAIAHLCEERGNLEVWTGARVERLVWEGGRVVGVVCGDGRGASCTKEVILTAGAIDTPKLLLLNGIGPKRELDALGIKVQKDIPSIGKHLSDHVMTFMSAEVDGSMNDRYAFESDSEALDAADKLWAEDNSGAFALQHSTLYGGFHKLDALVQSKEFADLPEDMQDFLNKARTPHYEFINNALLWPPGTKLDEGNTYMSFVAFLLNPQSEGSVTLRSANAADNPVIKLNYLTHPYDRLAFRHAIRATWTKLMENPKIKPLVRKTILGPKSMSDEDVDAFARETASTVWHANGTVRMGECTDSAGRVRGVGGLRVADLSVCPVTTNNHTQSTAYVVGAVIGGKVVGEYGL